jgi:predicted dehydrogenase
MRVGLIGYGLAGAHFHAPLIAAEPELELAAIVTRSPQRRDAARAAHPRAQLLDSAEELLALRPDLVVVATPNRLHVPQARAAIDAGIAVVVDKPLATTADEARALVEHARGRGVLLSVFHNRRWDGDFLELRSRLGELGQIVRFESRFERWRPEVNAAAWRDTQDGGVLLDLGTHLVDQALQLFGPVSDVYGEVRSVRAGARVDDDAFLALTHASGVQSHLWMSMVAADQGPRLRVLGLAGAWVKHGLDVQEAQLRAGMSPTDPEFGIEPDGVRGDYPAFYRGIVHALRDGAPPPVDPADAVAGLEVLEQAR